MNLHLLRMFMAVVEHQGFSRAAEALHVSQPAVSKAVRELEHKLGLSLVERGGARGPAVVLTDHGASRHQPARASLALPRRRKSVGWGKSGSVRVIRGGRHLIKK